MNSKLLWFVSSLVVMCLAVFPLLLVAAPVAHGESYPHESYGNVGGDGNVVSVNLSEFARFFQNYGPWAIVTVCIIALFFLYRSKENQRREFDAAMQKRHEQFIAMIEKLTNWYLNR